MKTIKLENVLALRLQGLNYREIGLRYGVNPSIPFKMVKGNIAVMKIGNKSPINSRKITKVWETFPEYHKMINFITNLYQSERESLIDYLLRYLYSRGESWMEKFSAIPEEHRAGWLYRCLRIETIHYFAHRDDRVKEILIGNEYVWNMKSIKEESK